MNTKKDSTFHLSETPFLPRSKPRDLELPRESLNQERILLLLDGMGLKRTPQRIRIIQALYRGRKHVTVTELHKRVNEERPKIGMATVLRLLRELVKCEFVLESRVGGRSARYEIKIQGHHDHLTCTHCGKICEFHNKAIEDLQIEVAKYFGFSLEYHVLELFGTCQKCSKKMSPLR